MCFSEVVAGGVGVVEASREGVMTSSWRPLRLLREDHAYAAWGASELCWEGFSCRRAVVGLRKLMGPVTWLDTCFSGVCRMRAWEERSVLRGMVVRKDYSF